MAKLITVLNDKYADVKYTSDNGYTGLLISKDDVIHVFNKKGEKISIMVGDHITIKQLVEYIDSLGGELNDKPAASDV